jgi:hypothetical protein
MQVSFYPQLLDYKTSQTIELLEVLAGIKGGRWAAEVLATRGLTSRTYVEAKKQLPCFTASGTFATRKDADLLTHSGLIAFDIDTQANVGIDLTTVRPRIEADPYTYACFTSVSGLNQVALVPIPTDEHRGSFRALAAYYQQAYGVAVDQICSNVSQLRFVSYDPNLYLNEQATTFRETLTESIGMDRRQFNASELIR